MAVTFESVLKKSQFWSSKCTDLLIYFDKLFFPKNCFWRHSHHLQQYLHYKYLRVLTSASKWLLRHFFTMNIGTHSSKKLFLTQELTQKTDVFFSINFRNGQKILIIMREIHLLHFKGILAHDWAAQLFREVCFRWKNMYPCLKKLSTRFQLDQATGFGHRRFRKIELLAMTDEVAATASPTCKQEC